MSRKLVHRGPDDEGIYCDDAVALANRRLSIIDPAGGKQPVHNEDETIWTVFNGELYNQADLRRDLVADGHKFISRADTEVLVHLYEEFGDRCPTHLNGMFAFAIWDAAEKAALVVRDRLGIKPLFYCRHGNLLLFASEIKAILEFPGFSPELDMDSVELYLTLRYVPRDKTIFRRIHKLLPGSLIRVDQRNGTYEIEQYWDPDPGAGSLAALSEDDLADELYELLADAVKIRLMSDVPFGAFLSGGLDSSGIVALMSEAMSEPVKTFSIGFSEIGKLDERIHANRIAREFCTEHREVDCTADKVEQLPMLIHHFDEPFADPIIVPTYQVAELAAQHVKVVLTGEGADELFGGYTRFVSDQKIHRLQILPAGMRRTLCRMSRKLPFAEQMVRALEMSELPDAQRFLSWVTAFELDEMPLLNDRNKSRTVGCAARVYEEQVRTFGSRPRTESMSYCETKIRLPELMLARTDRMSMAVSLEARTPFLDHRVVAKAMKIPGHFRVRNGNEKVILKKALSRILPRQIVARKKQGLAVPFALWTRYGIEEPISRILSSRRIKQRDFLDSKSVGRLLGEWKGNQARHSQRIWSVLCLELWCRMYLDGDLDFRTPLSEVS